MYKEYGTYTMLVLWVLFRILFINDAAKSFALQISEITMLISILKGFQKWVIFSNDLRSRSISNAHFFYRETSFKKRFLFTWSRRKLEDTAGNYICKKAPGQI